MYSCGASPLNRPPPTSASPFATISQPSCHVLAHQQTLSHTQEQRFAFASTPLEDVPKAKLANSSTSVTSEAAEEITQPVSAPPSNHQRKQIVTPLRHLKFEEELKSHTDPNWAHELITGITKGVSLGYQGRKCQRISKNLISAYSHPQIIDDELSKELRLQRIAGPFDTPPMANLQCSGVGVIPKKTGGWRMIMHLSAPQDNSINDGIHKDFTLHYSSIDDAVQMVHRLGRRMLLAKRISKVHFAPYQCG